MNARLRIVADENMVRVRDLFEPYGEVITAAGRSIDAALVADADVLLVRSVTNVDAALLAGSRVRFVGSATIGTDHVDLPWLAANGITFANSPGCNADAVGDYVIAALTACESDWRTKSVAIIGCGNVGSRLYRRLKSLRVDCRCYDPFLSPARQADLVTFGQALEADIVCLHTPLTQDGSHPTYHLFDASVLDCLNPGALLLNAGRGEVVDNTALLTRIHSGRLRAVLDVWEGEPAINPVLLNSVEIGTPHIAGYSLEGRVRGTLMVYDAFYQWLGQVSAEDDRRSMDTLLADQGPVKVLTVPPDAGFDEVVLAAYDPREDHRRLLAAVDQGEALETAFDRLRKEYPYRREFQYSQLPDGGETAPMAELVGLGILPPEVAPQEDHVPPLC